MAGSANATRRQEGAQFYPNLCGSNRAQFSRLFMTGLATRLQAKPQLREFDVGWQKDDFDGSKVTSNEPRRIQNERCSGQDYAWCFEISG